MTNNSDRDELDAELEKWLWSLVRTAQHPVHGKNLKDLTYTKKHLKEVLAKQVAKAERKLMEEMSWAVYDENGAFIPAEAIKFINKYSAELQQEGE